MHDIQFNDRSVSPVIGVVLMVAVTVILAAVITTFVFGLTNSAASEGSPAASFSADYDGENLTLTHTDGDRVAVNELYVRGDGITNTQWGGDASSSVDGEPAVVAGDSMTISGVSSDYDVRVVWQNEGRSTVLMHSQGPDA